MVINVNQASVQLASSNFNIRDFSGGGSVVLQQVIPNNISSKKRYLELFHIVHITEIPYMKQKLNALKKQPVNKKAHKTWALTFNFRPNHEIIFDSFSLLVIAIKKPITIIATPAQTRLTNGFILAVTLNTSFD